jgi:hypothetical protein
MDRNERITLPQLKEKMWEEVLLYDGLRKGPETKDVQGEIDWEDEKWGQTLKRLGSYFEDKDNQRRLVRELFLGETDKDWTRDKRREYVDKIKEVAIEIKNYNEQPRQPDDIKRLGQHLHKLLAQQSGRDRTREELLQGFNNAGKLELNPHDPEESYLVTDHHGKKKWLPKIFLPETFHWTMDQILADDPSENRRFKSDDCVRLKTNDYEIHGMPMGVEGYVLGAVSNKFLGWEANRYQVIFIVACTEEQDGMTVWDDFLEVTEDDLERCDTPSLRFLYQVDGKGRVIRDKQSGQFKRNKEVILYRYPELLDGLAAQQRQSGWSNIKSLWRKGKEGVRNGNQNISKKLKQMMGR